MVHQFLRGLPSLPIPEIPQMVHQFHRGLPSLPITEIPRMLHPRPLPHRHPAIPGPHRMFC
jgi:hypothetical protein